MNIAFDMDGTIVNLYQEEQWLERLRHHDKKIYLQAKPLINLRKFSKNVKKLQQEGINVGIISWLSKEDNISYNLNVYYQKIKWLKQHLPSITWNFIYIIPYGKNKSEYITSSSDILFDDNEEVRKEWKAIAYDQTKIFSIIEELL